MKKDKNSALLELAVIVPVLVVIVLGSTDLLLASMAQSKINSIAQMGVTCLSTPSCKVQTDAARNAGALGLNPDFLTVTVQGKTVEVSYIFHLFAPFFSWPHFTVKATSS